MIEHRYLNLDYLCSMAAGDQELENELMLMLINELSNCLPEMHRLWNSGQWLPLQQLCHHTKSTLIYCGNEIVIQANAALEEGLKNNLNKENLLIHLEKMETVFPFIIQELKAIVKA